MKRKRGRPPVKSYPQPHTIADGYDIAIYGKIGASEAMGIIRDCPYPTTEFIRIDSPHSRAQVGTKYFRSALNFADGWALRIGPIIGQKIASGDSEFFRQLADAVEKFSEGEENMETRRYLAIGYKGTCDRMGVPFTRKGLRNYYNCYCPGQTIDSSTLSRLFKWAQSAKRMPTSVPSWMIWLLERENRF
jgi:hypothetical protein